MEISGAEGAGDPSVSTLGTRHEDASWYEGGSSQGFALTTEVYGGGSPPSTVGRLLSEGGSGKGRPIKGEGFLEVRPLTGEGFLEVRPPAGEGFLEVRQLTGEGFLEVCQISVGRSPVS